MAIYEKLSDFCNVEANLTENEVYNTLQQLGCFVEKILADNYLYYTLPIWTYSKNDEGGWYEKFPKFFHSHLEKKKYEKLFSLVINKHIDFSFSGFVTRQLSKVPLFIEIEFGETIETLLDYPNKWILRLDKKLLKIEGLRDSEGDFTTKDIEILKNTKNYSYQYFWDKFEIDLKFLIKDKLFSISDFVEFFKFLCVYKYCFQELRKIIIVSSKLYKIDKTEEDISYGGIIIASHKQDVFEKGFDSILASIINLKYREIAVNDWVKRLERHAIKSAKSAIMSRNMSHNLGSHVMAYLKQKMGSVTDIVRERVLADLDQVEGSLKDIIHEANIELPFLIGLGRFINYLQERQDYIATISTNYIPYNTTISFKDFIYDELKPELRYRRHHQGDDAYDIIGRKPANLLLDYIAYSEGFQQSESIVLRFGCCDGCLPEQSLKGQAKIDFAKLREFEVAIPGGVVGRQGFFSIIENIIRNAAKHSSCRNDSKRLEIDINIVDVSDEESKWWQGIETFKGNNLEGETDEDLKKKYQKYSDKYYVVSITNRMRNSINSLERLKRGLAKDYIDEKGLIIEEAKGLKEMRISAAWLRSFSIDLDILEKTDEPPAVVVRAVNINETNKPVADTDTECGLQYYICLPKPRKVAFIVDNDLYQQYENLNKELFPLGGYIVKSKDIKDASLDQYDIVALIIEKSHIQENIYKSLKPLLSARLIECSQKILKELQRVIGEKSISDNKYDLLKTVISKVYKIWYNSLFPSEIYKNTKLVVLDAKTEKSNLTKLEDKIVLKTTASAKWSDYDHNVVFSTHYEGMLHEQEHPTCETNEGNILLENVSKAYFIEGITGNNSTDRLIRKNIWDEEWLYKHLVAGITKVAIFDERIFRFIAQPNELYIGFEKLNNAIPQIFRRPDVSLCELFPILDQSFGEDSVYKLAPGTLNKLALALIAYYKGGTKEQLSAKIKEEIHSCEYDITLAQRYHEAKVWAYDIKLGNNSDDINDRWIDIIGYSLPVNVKIGDMNNAEIKKIGTIRRVAQKRFQIDFELGYKVFDFISIHQGILDKIYSYFDIRDNADLKHIFTYDFYKALSSKSDSIVFNQVDKNNGNAFYFPQLIIHSGRSRPSYSDMPQLQPFIQFAAIENAVKDCKYTLSELLYSAHYEKSDCAN